MRLIDPMFFSAFEENRFAVSSRTGIWGERNQAAFFLASTLDQHPHNITLFHDKVLDAIDLDLGARPLAEQDAVADPDVDGDELAGLVGVQWR
jgi:hypothetical protein